MRLTTGPGWTSRSAQPGCRAGDREPLPRLRSVPDSTASDEVDHIVAAWRRERPDLDVEPMRVLSRVTRLARYLDRERSRAFSTHELETWEFDVLAALRRAGE